MNRFFQYLQAAFWVREKVPLLGHVPVNILVLLACVALGFGHPAFWLLGLAGEISFLWILVGSKRFRRWVDAVEESRTRQASSNERERLLARLTPPNRERFEALERQFASIETDYSRNHSGETFFLDNLENLRTLKRVFLRLLVATQRIEVPNHEENLAAIRRMIEEIGDEIDSGDLSPAVRRSKDETRRLLGKRIDVLENRSRSLAGIHSDLEQIETQFQLSRESAALDSSLAGEKLDLDLARSMITTPGYAAFLSDEGEVDPLLEEEALSE